MNILKTQIGSTARLVQYALLYFSLYAIFGTGVKYFQGAAADGFPGFTEIEFLIYSTLGSSIVCLGVIIFAKWWKFRWRMHEILFMILSGTCTAIVIPTTTLMYSLPISVMVAMVIMRGSIIVITRLMDTIMIWQGISNKKVRWEENVAVIISLCAVGYNIVYAQSKDFDFLNSKIAMGILFTYIVTYAVRIYLMNLFKFTRTPADTSNNKNFFAIEQLTASVWIYAFLITAAFMPQLWINTSASQAVEQFHSAFATPPEMWKWAMVIGLPFGFAAFFSVFLFMFEGRTSTFSGLVNRLSSLLAGTVSTLLFALMFGGKWPKVNDWIAFALVIIAVAFLARAEKLKNK